jgi:GNAT superfamily N-acetyltransferase
MPITAWSSCAWADSDEPLIRSAGEASTGSIAMVDAHGFDETETLKNGVTVKIRAVRPADKAGIADAFGKLDPESIYTRYFRAKESLSDQELKAATEVDFEDVVALVVTVASGEKETIIGGGRYLAFDVSGERHAEVAFMVEEDYHGLGIAGRLLKHLARIARGKGVRQFEAEVLPQNKAMLAVFSRSGLPMELTQTEGVIRVTLSLADRTQTERG